MTAYHTIFYLENRKAGIFGPLLMQFKSYLTDRVEQVKLNTFILNIHKGFLHYLYLPLADNMKLYHFKNRPFQAEVRFEQALWMVYQRNRSKYKQLKSRIPLSTLRKSTVSQRFLYLTVCDLGVFWTLCYTGHFQPHIDKVYNNVDFLQKTCKTYSPVSEEFKNMYL